MYSKQDFAIRTLLEFISVFIIETRNYSVLSLAPIASSFREEKLLFETVPSNPHSF